MVDIALVTNNRSFGFFIPHQDLDPILGLGERLSIAAPPFFVCPKILLLLLSPSSSWLHNGRHDESSASMKMEDTVGAFQGFCKAR